MTEQPKPKRNRAPGYLKKITQNRRAKLAAISKQYGFDGESDMLTAILNGTHKVVPVDNQEPPVSK